MTDIANHHHGGFVPGTRNLTCGCRDVPPLPPPAPGTVGALLNELRKYPRDAKVFTHASDKHEAEIELIGSAVWIYAS